MMPRRPGSGFTLIELVLVLAIAALVLAAILLAVGGAQRSQRDTTTKDSAARVATAFQNYAGNNNGVMPLFNQALSANYLTGIFDGAGGIPSKGASANRLAGKQIRYEGQAMGTTPGFNGAPIIAGQPHQYAVDYWSENANNDVCIDNQ